jgi:hypothetical protein
MDDAALVLSRLLFLREGELLQGGGNMDGDVNADIDFDIV